MTDQPSIELKPESGLEPEVEAVVHQEDVPTFDFGELSYEDMRRIERAHAKATKLSKQAKTEGITDEQAAALDAEANDLMDGVFDMLALTITYIPRAWLVKRTPEDVDITQPGMLRKFVRADRTMDVMSEFTASQEKKV